MPDFGDIPNLEELDLKGCKKLVQIDPSIGVLKKIYFLNLKDCKNLVNIPNNIFGLTSLKYLNLSGCRKLNKNPIPSQSKNLDSSESSSHSQSRTSSLKRTTIDLASSLLPSFLSLNCLSEVDISFCGLSQLPGAIGCLRQLERLNIGGNNFVTLPNLEELSKLVYLNLEHCRLLESLPLLPFPTFFDQMTKHKTTMKNMKIYYKRKVGLVIFNCPKLGESEHCDNIAFSWMTQFIQARQKSSNALFDDIDIDIVIPGSEIPIWFYYQSESDSIRMKLSPVMDNNFIGIACCAVFSAERFDEIEPLYPEIELKFHKPINSNTSTVCFHRSFRLILETDVIVVKSNHTCLIYITKRSFFHILKSIDHTLAHLDDIIMNVSFCNGDSDFDVQHCGYRLVYEHDVEEFKLAMMHPENLSTRKRKFLAIEDEPFRAGSMDDLS